MALDPKAHRAMESLLGKQGILIDPVDRKLYEYDGGVHMAIPDVVVLARRMQGAARAQESPGYGFVALLAGSERIMAVVTEVGVRLVRDPESVKSMRTTYNTVAEAGKKRCDMTAKGITPVGLEMLDGRMVRM